MRGLHRSSPRVARRSTHLHLAEMHLADCQRPDPTVHAPLPSTHAQTYVLKLARSGEDGDKVLLLIESGVRYHTVEVGAPRGQLTAGSHAGQPACAGHA